jgi:polygalacturonase
MKTIRPIITLLLLFTGISAMAQHHQKPMTAVDSILKNISIPKFKKAVYDITAYGAIANGQSDIKTALDKAISLCSVSDGGEVLIPKGKFYIAGPVVLKSHVNLHFEDGAELIFSGGPKDYLPAVLTLWEGT